MPGTKRRLVKPSGTGAIRSLGVQSVRVYETSLRLPVSLRSTPVLVALSSAPSSFTRRRWGSAPGSKTMQTTHRRRPQHRGQAARRSVELGEAPSRVCESTLSARCPIERPHAREPSSRPTWLTVRSFPQAMPLAKICLFVVRTCVSISPRSPFQGDVPTMVAQEDLVCLQK